MSDAPERIWAWEQSATNIRLWRENSDRSGSVEYVRADLIRDAVLAGMRIATSTSIEMVPQAIQVAINEIMGGKND